MLVLGSVPKTPFLVQEIEASEVDRPAKILGFSINVPLGRSTILGS